MELDSFENIEKIAAKIKGVDRTKRIETAQELNELAKIIIEWHRAEHEEASNTIHSSIV